MVKQWTRDGWTVENLMVEQWNSETEMVEQGDRNGGIVEHLMVER